MRRRGTILLAGALFVATAAGGRGQEPPGKGGAPSGEAAGGERTGEAAGGERAGEAAGGERTGEAKTASAPERSDASAEDRLLRAELLELSSGELEAAMKIYRALWQDEALERSVRARALLALARCQRKRGELERAREGLEALVKEYPAERETVRRARSLLAELRSARAANPRFDWIGDLQRNPEIQARVFESVMDLVDSGEAGRRAGRRLLALGTIALPALERAVGSSRDAEHRRRLASILLQLGRYEHVGAALPAGHDPWKRYEPLLDGFLRSLARLEEAEKKRLRAALEASPAAGAEGGVRDMILLWCGERSELARRLARFEGRRAVEIHPGSGVGTSHDYGRRALLELLAREEGSRPALLERILAPGVQRPEEYIFALENEKEGLASLEPRHYVASLQSALAAGRSLPEEHFTALEAFGGLEEILRSKRADELLPAALDYFAGIWSERLGEAPPGWAKLLRAGGAREVKVSPIGSRPVAARAFVLLRRMAEAQDGVIEEYAAWLRSLPEGEVPELWSEVSQWRPSPAFSRMAASLLDSRHPFVLAVALEALALAPVGSGEEVTSELERFVLDPPDLHLRELALHALLSRFEKRPESGAEVARILVEDHRRRAGKEVPESYLRSPLAGVALFGHVARPQVFAPSPASTGRGLRFRNVPVAGAARAILVREVTAPVPFYVERTSGRELDATAWAYREAGEATLRKLAPHLLGRCGSREGRPLYRWVWALLPEERRASWLAEDLASGRPREPEIVEFGFTLLSGSWHVVKLRPLARRTVRRTPGSPRPRPWSLVRTSRGFPVDVGALPPAFAALAREVATRSDGAISLEARAFAVELFARRGAAQWFDWPRFLRGSDALAGRLAPVVELLLDPDPDTGIGLAPEARGEILDAALASSWPACRLAAVRGLEGVIEEVPGRIARLRARVDDPSGEVRAAALDAALRIEAPELEEEIARLVADLVRAQELGDEPAFPSGWGDWIKSRGRPSLAPVARAALQSRSSLLRRYALDTGKLCSALDDPVAAYEPLLADPDPRVHQKALERLLASRSMRAAPVLLGLLAKPEHAGERVGIVEALGRLAAPESVEPLLALVGSDDVAVRDGAIAALAKIRRRLEEKRQWTEILDDLRAGRAAGGSAQSADSGANSGAEPAPEPDPPSPPKP